MTQLTALWYVTGVLAKPNTYNEIVNLKRNKRKNAELETTEVTIRPGSKSKKGQKNLPQLNYDKHVQ